MSDEAKSPKDINWSTVLAQTGPYPLEAYGFVRQGLTFTSQKVHGNPERLPEDQRHISGQQLCLGLRDYAIDQYGLMAPVVLAHWKIERTDDFGRIVFAMIEHGLMSRTDEDSVEDFRGVYDFSEAFCEKELVSRLSK